MRISKIFPLICTSVLALGFTACSDEDETPAVVIDQDVAQVHETGSTYNSLTFAWNKIAGVNQYGYTLQDADGATVEEGVTEFNSVSFTDLHTDYTYTFELRVYGAAFEPSYRTSVKATTLPIRQLETPQPSWEQTGNKIKLSWEPIEGAASYYCHYSIGDNSYDVYTDETTLAVAGLAPGKHDLTLEALSDYGGYTDSEIAKLTVERTRTEVATVSGTYTSGLIRRNNSWAATMHIFDDDTYTIDAFYQGDGYNLELYADTDSETGARFVGIYNFISYPNSEYYVMDTGRSSVPQIDMIPGLADGEYGSSIEGDATSGTISINTRYSTASGTDKFVW